VVIRFTAVKGRLIYYLCNISVRGLLKNFAVSTSVDSYNRVMWVVYSGEVRGEVGSRSRMCYIGCVAWVHGFCYYMLFLVNIVKLQYHLMFVENYMYMYT